MAVQSFCIKTASQRELAAGTAIAALGFPTFCPLYPAEKIRFGKVERRISPLFPSYIFAQFDIGVDPWGAISHAKWVSYILKNGNGKPTPVSDSVISAIQNYTMSTPSVPLSPTFAMNQRIRIKDGTFQGLEGLFKGSSKDRVIVLLDVLGKTNVEMPIESVIAA